MRFLRKSYEKYTNARSLDAEITRNRECFTKTIHTIQSMLDNSSLDVEKAQILEYAINVIGRDISCSTSARLLYAGETPEYATFSIPTPQCAYIGRENYSLSELNVVIDTYDTEKLWKAIHSVYKQGFRKEMGNYTGILYPEINLAIIINGRHHLSAAIAQKSGCASLSVTSLTKAFPTLTTDGAYWYFPNISPKRVYDYRIAALYELARLKHNLQLPDNPELLTALELTAPDSFDHTAYHGEHYFRIKILELEINIKNHQLQLLRDKKSPDDVDAEIEQLEKVTAELKQEFQDWVNRVSG